MHRLKLTKNTDVQLYKTIKKKNHLKVVVCLEFCFVFLVLLQADFSLQVDMQSVTLFKKIVRSPTVPIVSMVSHR